MEKLKLYLLLIFGVLNLNQLKFAESVCLLNYPKAIETAPIYAKNLSKYILYLPYNEKGLELQEGENIQAKCRTYFKPISYTNSRHRYSFPYNDEHDYNNEPDYNIEPDYSDEPKAFKNQTSISLQCRGGQLYSNTLILRETMLECNKLNWSVFDAKETYEWCEKNENAKTFLLAAKSNEDHHILAGICFNVNEWSLQTITYNVTSSGQKYNIEMQRDITKTELKSFQSLGEEIWNLKSTYFDLTEQDLRQQLSDLTATNSWLNLANYELSPIVQGHSYGKYFKEYVHILNIVWWHNLRMGNWKLFMNTLENYASKNSFQLYTGTSGVVRIPTKNVNDNSILEIKNGYLNETVPGYIWTYLTSTDNLNEDFIIVGYNSPYAEWFDVNNVIFCPDICSEIPWLKDIKSSFRFSTAGIMFCCSPDFVQQTNYLHGFPTDVLRARATQKQTKILKIENTSKSILNSTKEEVSKMKIRKVIHVF